MEELIIKDKRYLMGILTGIILAAIAVVGVGRYQGNLFFMNKEVVLEETLSNDVNEKVDISQRLTGSEELKERIKNEVNEIQKEGITLNQEVTPETPHSPQLQRLALILREANRMVERMEKNIVEISETQTANINQ